MNPIVYLREGQISALFHAANNKEQIVEGNAYAWDSGTVFHGYTQAPDVRPAGIPTDVRFVVAPKSKVLEQNDSVPPKAYIQSKASQPSLLILLAIHTNVLRHKCFLIRNGTSVAICDIRFIPEESDLYSRSKGLLETDILQKKTVAIIGLGSGGSPIAVELAKASVGRFVLIDFDRLELSNVARHVCGISDLGRYKTLAVRDQILQKNPHATVTTLEIDVIERRDECSQALKKADVIICASDNDRSRFLLNEIALRHKVPAIFGRAITRATGGDVFRVRPFIGPCYSCLYSQNVRQEGGDDEEISQQAQAKSLLPEYTSEQDVRVAIQVGLSSDIAPISNFMTKLSLLELSRGLNSGIKSLEEDLIADLYIWANRRDNVYQNWPKLEFNFNKPSILRWYGARVGRDPNCLVCGDNR